MPDPAKRRANAYASARRYPDRRRAREALNEAVRRGRLSRAAQCICVDCGNPAAAYDHHEGYDKPLTVQPVCHKCHGRRSRERGEHKGKRGPTPKAGGRMLDGRTWDEYPK